MPSLEELVQRFLLFFKEVFNIELPCHNFNLSLPSFLLPALTTILFSMTKLEKSHVDSHADDRGPDLVPRSRFGGSRTKNQGRGEGKGEEETRSGKIRIETSADWLFHNGRESSTRVLFLSLAA